MSSRQKLHTQFLRQLLPLLALAYIVAAAFTAGLYYQDQRSNAQSERNQTLETFANVLIKPLWDCNSLTAGGIIQAITLQPNVQWASAPDQCAQKLIQSGTPSNHNNVDTLSTPLHYVDENGRSHPLGELNIAFKPISVFTAASRNLLPQLALFLTILAAVLASALWIFERTIGKPLLQLRQAMHQHQTLDPIPADWTVELTEVTHTYNTQLQTLRSQARHDPLTGLGNRLKLEEDLSRTIRQVERTGSQGHVLLLDLDQFKAINDTFGHAAGDEVLLTVAHRLLACVRGTDTVIRLGGDEFVIITVDIASDSDTDDIFTLAKRIRQTLAQPIAWQDTYLQISASIGIAPFDRHGNTSTALLAQADANMYWHKGQQSK